MKLRFRLRAAVHAAVAALPLAVSAPRIAAAGEPAAACDAAAVKAEREWNLPHGLLAAVGTVEAGRRTAKGGAAPWPWTINAAGRGSFFESKEEAIAAVLGLMLRGYPYIDVGCFQIDLGYHPGVFHSLEEAFDPERNAQEAARILVQERARGADWSTAVARYHSANPEHGGPYLERVRAALPAARLRATAALTGDAAPSASVPGADSVPLPKVVYPPALLGNGRGPQILHIGAASAPAPIREASR